MKRIGMLTSGGDCQALNAAMRGVVKGLNANLDELEIYGFYDGYKGLIYGNYRLLTSKDFSGILTKGGTILGTSRQPFKYMRVPVVSRAHWTLRQELLTASILQQLLTTVYLSLKSWDTKLAGFRFMPVWQAVLISF